MILYSCTVCPFVVCTAVKFKVYLLRNLGRRSVWYGGRWHIGEIVCEPVFLGFVSRVFGVRGFKRAK